MDCVAEFKSRNNIEAEVIVLSTIIGDNFLYSNQHTENAIFYLTEDDFSLPDHKVLFRVIRALKRDNMEVNKMTLLEYILNNHECTDMNPVTLVNSLNKPCQEPIFWEFVKLIERKAWEEQQQRWLLFIGKILEEVRINGQN